MFWGNILAIAHEVKNDTQLPLRVLCCVPHYFAERTGDAYLGPWKSVSQQPDIRRDYVEQTIASLSNLSSLPEVATVDVRVCGIHGNALVSLDVEFDEPEPLFLVFDTLQWMLERREDYDYYLLVEDDIEVPAEVLANVIAFDHLSMVNEVLHPNRIELENGVAFNTDLKTFGEWTTQRKLFRGRPLVVNANPHSAVFILSASKFNYCADHADLALRERLRIGKFRGGMMASAFANFLSPVSLYRVYDDLTFHYVVHQDPFQPHLSTYHKLSRFARSVLPPPLVETVKRLKRRVSRR
jgi:hypothetical protein